MRPLPGERADGEEPEVLGRGLRAGGPPGIGQQAPGRPSAQGAGGVWGPWVRGQPWLLWPRAHLQDCQGLLPLDYGEQQSFTSFAFGQPDNQG